MSAEQQEDTQTQEPMQSADGQEKRNSKPQEKRAATKGQQRKQPARGRGAGQAAEQEEQEPSPIKVAAIDLTMSLKDTFTELGNTLRALLETVQSLLKSVAALLKVIATSLSEGLQRIGLPLGRDESNGGIGAWMQVILHALASFGKSIMARMRGGEGEAQPADAGD